MIAQHSHYRSYLRSILADRKQKHPSYSMRAFAKHLGITQSAVSQILSGKRNLSQDTALKVSERLGLNAMETEYFSLLVQLETSKSPAFRESLLKRINLLKPITPIHELSLDLFRVISDWYHLVIRNIADIDGFEMHPRILAKRLGISAIEVEAAIDRLLRLELLERLSGERHRYRKTQDYILAKATIPNEALRTFHGQMLEKAKASLTTQTPKEKIIGSETFSFSSKYLSEANQITEEYFQKMSALARKPGGKNHVYHLGVQFFNVTKENP